MSPTEQPERRLSSLTESATNRVTRAPSLTVLSRIIMSYSIWDILKCDGDYYFAMYDTMDSRNKIVLAPRGGPPPPSTKLFKLSVIMELIPPHVMEEMVESYLKVFGHVKHAKEHLEGPQPCSMDDLADIKNCISYYQVD